MTTLRRGLPYGWWRDPEFWTVAVCAVFLFALIAALVLAWLFH